MSHLNNTYRVQREKKLLILHWVNSTRTVYNLRRNKHRGLVFLSNSGLVHTRKIFSNIYRGGGMPTWTIQPIRACVTSARIILFRLVAKQHLHLLFLVDRWTVIRINPLATNLMIFAVILPTVVAYDGLYGAIYNGRAVKMLTIFITVFLPGVSQNHLRQLWDHLG